MTSRKKTLGNSGTSPVLFTEKRVGKGEREGFFDRGKRETEEEEERELESEGCEVGCDSERPRPSLAKSPSPAPLHCSHSFLLILPLVVFLHWIQFASTRHKKTGKIY